MAWWNTWYESATQAVSASMSAAQASVASLFKEPPTGSIAYAPDDAPLSDVLRDRQAGYAKLFPVPPEPFPKSTDLQQALLERPKTWDELSWWEKAKTYAGDIIPNAAFETFGVTRAERGSSEQPGTTTGDPTHVRGGAIVASERWEEPIQQGAGEIYRTVTTAGAEVGKALSGLPSFLQGTLTRIIIGLALILAIIFMANRFLAKRGI